MASSPAIRWKLPSAMCTGASSCVRCKQRLPAAQARLLYEETEDSRLQRETQIERGKLSGEPATEVKGRPTKRDRRRLQRFLG